MQYDPNANPQALAAQNSYWQAMLQRLGIGPQAFLGSGMAQQAAQTLQNRPGLLQLQEAQALGMAPQQQQGRGLLSF